MYESTVAGEAGRLEALERYQILDTPPEEPFDRITRLAARLLNTPLALLSLIDAQRHWIKARVGTDLREYSRDISLCAQVVSSGEMLVVPDTHADPRFRANPLVIGPPHIRFYAGAPLRTAEGYILGTLCVIDQKPRTLSDDDLEALQDLAALVVEQLERRRAEEASKRAQVRVEEILNSISDACYTVDEDWRITFFNEQAEPFLPGAEALGRTLWSLFPEAVGTPFYDVLHRALEDQVPGSITDYYAPMQRWFEVRAYPFREGLSVYFQDVTETVLNQEFLAAQNRIMEKVASGAPLEELLEALVLAVEARSSGFKGSVLLLDQEGKHLQVGAAPSLPEAYNRFIHGVEIGPFVGSCGTAAYSGENVIAADIEHDPRWADYLIALDFGLRACWSRPIFSSSGEVLGTFALYYPDRRDPTEADLRLIETAGHIAGIAIEHSRWERTLREGEAHLRAVFNQAAVGFAQTDLEGRLVLVNQRFCEFIGRTPEEVKGLTIADITHPDDLAPSRVALARILAGEGHVSFEKRYVRPDGTAIWSSSNVSVVRDQDGQPRYFLNVAQDITDRRRAEELQRSNEDLEQFAYVASHDLQEPLRKIGSFAGILSNEYQDRLDEDGRYYLERILDASTRMAGLIQDLLTYSRVSTQGQPFRPVDLNETVRGVLSDLEFRIQEQNGRVEVGELPTLQADPTQMRQLFQNLIGNALKFMREDVPPVVRVSAERLEGAGGGVAGRYRIIVEDNGIGFDEKNLSRIFTPFKRLHGRGKYEGTGVGLAICKKIAVRHGGTITAHSAPDQGARFIVVLPERPGAQVAP